MSNKEKAKMDKRDRASIKSIVKNVKQIGGVIASAAAAVVIVIIGASKSKSSK